MVISCSAYGCSNRQKKGVNISFHSFPSDKILRQKWIMAMKRDNFEPSKYAKLCSEHFQVEDFEHTFGLKTLKPGTIPTIFQFPPHLLKKPPKQRSERLRIKAVTESSFADHAHSPVPNSSHSVAITDNMEQEPIACTSSEFPQVSLTPPSAVVQSRKRKRGQPVYMGDLSEADLNDPKRVKKMRDIATKTINRQKQRISYLQTKVCRLQKRIKSLSDLVDHLKNMNKVSSECHLLLQV